MRILLSAFLSCAFLLLFACLCVACASFPSSWFWPAMPSAAPSEGLLETLLSPTHDVLCQHAEGMVCGVHRGSNSLASHGRCLPLSCAWRLLSVFPLFACLSLFDCGPARVRGGGRTHVHTLVSCSPDGAIPCRVVCCSRRVSPIPFSRFLPLPGLSMHEGHCTHAYSPGSAGQGRW